MDALSYILIICCFYILYRVWKFVHFVLGEYYVLWRIATGASGSRRSISAKVRQHAYVCKTNLLDEVSINELYTFLVKMMDSDVTISDFHAITLTYKYVIVFRERKDGSLRGVTMMGVDRREHEGKKYTLIRLGLSFFQNFYRGGPLLYYVVFYHMFKELFWHPFTPLYLIGKLFSYKSYLAIAHSFKEVYPRFDAETPDFEKSIINSFGTNVKYATEEYDAENFILKREKTMLKERIAPVSTEDMKNDHIRFFVERNPGWQKGHQLITLGRITWYDFWTRLFQKGRRSQGEKKRKHSTPRSLTRQFSFQSESACRYATVFSEMDMFGARMDVVNTANNEGEGFRSRSRTYSNQHAYNIYDN